MNDMSELFSTQRRTNTATAKKVVSHSLAELYSGPGGVGLGAALASVETESHIWQTEPLWTNDLDADSCETWKKNVLGYSLKHKTRTRQEPVQVMAGDVRKLDLDALPDVDGLMFGFPCNDFSLVGEKKGFDGDFGPLYTYGVKVLQRKNAPKWFLAENVGGITSNNEGRAFAKIMTDMREAGYTVVAHKFKFEEYGVPQARHRVIIVGFRNDLGLKYAPPKPSDAVVTAAEALADIPSWSSGNELTRQSATVVERLSYIEPGENIWNAPNVPDHLRLNVKNTKLSHIYKKLKPDAPAYTVTGSGGGGTHMYHWAHNRALTNRERARLQTFPDWFDFQGSKESVRKQIGMAIPVEGARQIVESILKTLAGVRYDSIPSNLPDA